MALFLSFELDYGHGQLDPAFERFEILVALGLDRLEYTHELRR